MSDATDPSIVLDHLIAKAGQLYSLPAVAMEVLRLTNNPQVDAHALKECIENDPALTAKLLRVVNSSLFGLSREVSDLNQALALLGTKPLKLLVLGFSLPVGLFADVEGEILGRYWRHTLTKAVAGREISETLFDVPGDEAFIAGLLQDLGMLLLIQELGEPYARFLDKVADSSNTLAALEMESMGFEHTQVTARLLAMWGLPEMLVRAVALETPDEPLADAPSSEKFLPQILRLAELLARLLADQQPEALGELLQAGLQYPRLTDERLEALVTDLGGKVRQLADVLSLQFSGGLDYRDVLVRAHGQLSAVAALAAEDLIRDSQDEAAVSKEAAAMAEIQALADAVAAVSAMPTGRRGKAEFSPPDSDPRDTEYSSPTSSAVASSAVASSAVATAAVATADPGLLGRLSATAAGCRQSRCPLSLMLVRVEDVADLMMAHGMDGFQHLRHFLGTFCAGMEHPGSVCVPHNETGFALILPDCERREALELGNRLIEAVRRLVPVSSKATSSVASLTIGVATVALPPKNFPAEELFLSAERCLRASEASGGGVVKSIEIY